jgi:endogenous inhibitor of DNA gyrase (YacG/DUF329 family)
VEPELVEEVAEVQLVIIINKMKKNCPLCDKKLISSIGKGCKMCGMPLKDKSRDFCSKKCEIKYRNIRKDE